METEDLTIPLDEVDEGLVDRLEVPEGVGEVEGSIQKGWRRSPRGEL